MTQTFCHHPILMFDPNSSISQILSKTTDPFCPILIVVDGLVLPVSTASHFRCSDNRLWIPSTTKIIPSKWVEVKGN
jgi:hypothetical protein